MGTPVRLAPGGFGATSRRDVWWATPLAIFIGLSLFVVYATWAAFQNAHYTYGPYLSPFYSPELFGESPHAWFGPKPAWIPAWVPFSPALLILPFPGQDVCHVLREHNKHDEFIGPRPDHHVRICGGTTSFPASRAKCSPTT
ncbi:MAG: hypothetical protein HYY76_11250, partial [Acidobacteria bacterium]|nr:hypothetical protein [Acidobacteriota bacterium]